MATAREQSNLHMPRPILTVAQKQNKTAVLLLHLKNSVPNTCKTHTLQKFSFAACKTEFIWSSSSCDCLETDDNDGIKKSEAFRFTEAKWPDHFGRKELVQSRGHLYQLCLESLWRARSWTRKNVFLTFRFSFRFTEAFRFRFSLQWSVSLQIFASVKRNASVEPKLSLNNI